jgi:hypothetical protein
MFEEQFDFQNRLSKEKYLERVASCFDSRSKPLAFRMSSRGAERRGDLVLGGIPCDVRNGEFQNQIGGEE